MRDGLWDAGARDGGRAGGRGRARAGPRPPAGPGERLEAGESAEAIRASIADPAAAGGRRAVHVDLSRPRRGVWIVTWERVPGLSLDRGAREYSHALLPGWTYSPRELRTEMLDDLDRLADDGGRPTEATRGPGIKGTGRG